MPRVPDRRSDARGFTMVELLIATIMGLMVMAATFSVFISQTRQQGLHRETMDARETLRGAAALLSSELRPLSASLGDLYAIAPQSVTLRSIQGAGTICAVHAAQPWYGVWQPSGTFAATADDSAFVYSVSNATWNIVKVAQVWINPATPGVPFCAWGVAFASDIAVWVTVVAPGDTAGVGVGSGIRPFRRIEYGMFQQNGRWWLGRKVGAAASYELVTGPLRSSADSGLVFHYYDAAGAETADRSLVQRVEIVLRSESFGMARSSSGLGVRLDSVTVVTLLRN